MLTGVCVGSPRRFSSFFKTESIPLQVPAGGSGTSPAAVWCVQMEKSQRTFSLSLWNTDASPSRAPTASTCEETRGGRSWATAQPSTPQLCGSIDRPPPTVGGGGGDQSGPFFRQLCPSGLMW